LIPVPELSIACKFFALCRVVPRKIATMIKFTTSLSHLPANSTDMTGADRVTYRRWAYGWLIAYSVMIGGVVAFSVATRPEPPRMQASRAIETAANSTGSIPVNHKMEHRR
jgi:hypothetical protein